MTYRVICLLCVMFIVLKGVDKYKHCLHKVFSYIIRTDMNFEILLQLAAILFVFAAGPLVIILLASRSGNL